MQKIGADGKQALSRTYYKAPYVTPAQFAALTPSDGDEVYLVVDATKGIAWHFRYNASSSSAYKWEFLGGPEWEASVDTSESTTSSTYVDLATVGPSLVLPRSGDYTVRVTGGDNGSSSSVSWISSQWGGVAVDSTAAVFVSTGGANVSARQRYFAAGVAGATAKAQYRSSGTGTSWFRFRTLHLLPIRIS